MLQDSRTSLRSSRPLSPRPIAGTGRECSCETGHTLFGPNAMETGIVAWCPSCNIVGTFFFASMVSLHPLKFNEPLRGK